MVLADAAAVPAAIIAASRGKGRSFIVLAVVDGVRQMLNRYSLRLGCSRTKSDEIVHEQQVSSPFLASFSSSSFFDRLPAAMTKRKQNYSLKASFSSSSLFARLPAAMKKESKEKASFSSCESCSGSIFRIRSIACGNDKKKANKQTTGTCCTETCNVVIDCRGKNEAICSCLAN